MRRPTGAKLECYLNLVNTTRLAPSCGPHCRRRAAAGAGCQGSRFWNWLAAASKIPLLTVNDYVGSELLALRTPAIRTTPQCAQAIRAEVDVHGNS